MHFYKNFIHDSYEVITVGFSKMYLLCKCDGIIENTNTIQLQNNTNLHSQYI